MEPERSAGESGRPASRTHAREVDRVPFGGKPFAIELIDTAVADIGAQNDGGGGAMRAKKRFLSVPVRRVSASHSQDRAIGRPCHRQITPWVSTRRTCR